MSRSRLNKDNDPDYDRPTTRFNVKREGGAAHPADVYRHCGCEDCERRWLSQLAAWKLDQDKHVASLRARATGMDGQSNT